MLNRRDLLLGSLLLALAGCSLPGSGSDAAVRPGSGPTLATAPDATFGVLAGALVRACGQEATNLVLSPWSIGTVLAMVTGGAGGATRAQLEKALGASADELPALVNTVWNALDAAAGLELSGANQVWAEESLTWKDAYLAHLDAFGAPLRREPIGVEGERVRTEINDWVSERTAGLIPGLVEPGLITPDTRMVLVNALHAKGAWAEPFTPWQTHPFTTAARGRVDVDWLVGGGHWPWVETDQFTGTAIAVEGDEVALVVLRPNAPTVLPLAGPLPAAATLDHVVTEAAVGAVLDAPAGTVSLGMPVWRVASDLSLADALAALGVTDAFDPYRADFAGMTDDEALHIGFVVHSAVMDVDADGFEAAAATAAGMEAGSAPMEVHELDLDRPFGFALVHVPTRTVLFAGHVGDPTA